MVNGAKLRLPLAWAIGVAILLAAAWLRGAEYDEQYTLFLTAGLPRPPWPATPFPAGLVRAIQAGHSSPLAILRDLRATDVHPPVYFWAIALWRALFGPGLLTARLFSVLCGAVSLALVGCLARRVGRPPAAAVLLTACSYGFAYTNVVARGFAPAELALLAGMLALLRGRAGWAGAAFGLAGACNYLAVFPALAAGGLTRAWRAIPAALPFLALDAWCFAAQHGARDGQFPPFAWLPSLQRLAGYQVAALFGALPLYWHGPARLLALAAVGLAALLFALRLAPAVLHTRRAPPYPILLAAGLAPAAGLLALGLIFDTTPIEFRYLAFGLPFLCILAAAPGWGRAVILTVQAAGIAGLLLAPRTMQPARAAAAALPPPRRGDLALLPAGNDGVGIVGAFGIEAPPTLSLLLVHPGTPIAIPAAAARVLLIPIAQDEASRAVLPAMRAALSAPDWRRVANSGTLEVYERTQAGG